jgi:hypothetical protein
VLSSQGSSVIEVREREGGMLGQKDGDRGVGMWDFGGKVGRMLVMVALCKKAGSCFGIW